MNYLLHSTPPMDRFVRRKILMVQIFPFKHLEAYTCKKNLSEWLHGIKYMSYQQLTMQWLFTIYSMISACIQKCFSRLKSSFAFKSKITINFFYKIN